VKSNSLSVGKYLYKRIFIRLIIITGSIINSFILCDFHSLHVTVCRLAICGGLNKPNLSVNDFILIQNQLQIKPNPPLANVVMGGVIFVIFACTLSATFIKHQHQEHFLQPLI
jgi:hypothetical protein